MSETHPAVAPDLLAAVQPVAAYLRALLALQERAADVPLPDRIALLAINDQRVTVGEIRALLTALERLEGPR